MKAHGLAYLGRDAEIRFTTQGEPVTNLSLAFSYGKRGDDGKRPTQWVEASLWGKRAEALAPYLLKGSQIVAYLDDVHIETFEGKNGAGHKLAARVADIELVSARTDGAKSDLDRLRAAGDAITAPPKPKPATRIDDVDSDIPF